MSAKLSSVEFITKAIAKHGYLFDYTDTIYIKSTIKVNITCKQHGVFAQLPYNHLAGQGCPICKKMKISRAQTKSQDVYIQQVKNIHNNRYDYTDTVYKGDGVKINISCDIHGVFTQRAGDHLNGQGCPSCKGTRISKTNTKPQEKFIIDANTIHHNKYDYANTIYANSWTKVAILCPIHGIFAQRPKAHLCGQGCPICGMNNKSKRCTDWLNTIMQNENIFIQHQDNLGEYHIPNTKFKADGFCKTTNTIYEFHGDLWHGNPNKYEPHIKCNHYSDLTAGELYQNTMNREKQIRDLGYNLIVIWESDYINSIKDH